MSGAQSRLSIRFATVADAETIHAAMIGIATTMGEREKVVIFAVKPVAQCREQHPRLEPELAPRTGDRVACRPAFNEPFNARGKVGDLVAIDQRHQGRLAMVGFDHRGIEHLVLEREMGAQDAGETGQLEGQRKGVLVGPIVRDIDKNLVDHRLCGVVLGPQGSRTRH